MGVRSYTFRYTGTFPFFVFLGIILHNIFPFPFKKFSLCFSWNPNSERGLQLYTQIPLIFRWEGEDKIRGIPGLGFELESFSQLYLMFLVRFAQLGKEKQWNCGPAAPYIYKGENETHQIDHQYLHSLSEEKKK